MRGEKLVKHSYTQEIIVEEQAIEDGRGEYLSRGPDVEEAVRVETLE